MAASGGELRHEDVEPTQKGWVVYTAYGLVLLAILATALILFNNHRANQDARLAQERAETLQSMLTTAGYESLDTDTIVQVLGSDGGQVCADAGRKLLGGEGVGLVNGADGPGLRPSTTDAALVQVGRDVVQVYCPDKLDEYDDYVSSLHLTDTTSQDND